MKSREPVLTHGRDEWDEMNLPRAEFENRIKEIRAAMDSQRLDAALVYGRGDRDGALCYVSNLINKVPVWGLLVVVTPDTVTVLNERSSRTRPVLERGTWIEDIQFCDEVVTEVPGLVDVTDKDTRIGIVGFGAMPHPQRETFSGLTKQCDVIEFDAAVERIRERKSERERDQITRAGRIVREVHDRLAEFRPLPARETDLETEGDYVARLRGAQDFRFLIANPARTERHLRPAERQQISGDEPVTMYAACRRENYWAERTRTYRLDGETPYGPAYDRLGEVYEDFLASVQAGARIDDVAKRVRAEAEAADVPLLSEYSLGNGIGLEVEEQPAIAADSDAQLAENSVVAVQLVAAPGPDGILAFGDTVRVQDGEPEVLTD